MTQNNYQTSKSPRILRKRSFARILSFLLIIAPLRAEDAPESKPEVAETATVDPEEHYAQAIVFFATGDLQKAASLFKKGADAGHLGSMFRYSDCVATGRGVERNDAEALNWCRKAAIRGNTGAQRTLGFWYEIGREVEKDVNQAIYWYRIAADNGDRDSRLFLGEIYLTGKDDGNNEQEGLAILQAAAKEDSAYAHFTLSKAFEEGTGVEADPDTALGHLTRSAQLGYAEAQYKLGSVTASAALVESDGVQAGEWMRKAAVQEYPNAEFLMAIWTFEGVIFERNDEDVLRWLQRAAIHGAVPAARLMQVIDLPEESVETALTRFLGAIAADDKQAEYIRKSALETTMDAETGNRNPRPVRVVNPVRPDIKGLNKLNGRVVVLIKIDERGTVIEAEVTETIHEAFNQPAIDAVMQWRFQPALKDGKPAPARLKLPLMF